MKFRACQICSIYFGVWDLGSLAMEIVLRELSGQLRSLNLSLLNCERHLLFYHYFCNVLDLFL